MCKVNDFKNVFAELGINSKKAVSIYRYSPVFKFKENNEFYILKRTKKDEDRINKLFQFEKLLKNNNISVVTPVQRRGCEQVLINDDRWVVYPFIDGEPYNASIDHIEKAGDLLGKIHKSSNNTFNHGFTWSTYEEDYFNELSDDINTIKSNYTDKVSKKVLINLQSQVESVQSTKYENLKSLDLPMVDGIWDFKASNLIYSNDMVTLVDLDNSGFIPRLFDLALALILFNTESTLAPNRVFSVEEWNVFLDAYKKHITLSELEIEIWQLYLRFVYTDEALWAIVDLDDNETQRQVSFIQNLLSFDFELYCL